MYRYTCCLLTREAAPVPPPWVVTPMSLSLLFVAPDRRRYDRDNLIARMKAAIDGIADGLGIDDNLFVALSSRIAPHVVPHGEVRVTISQETVDA